MPTDMAWVWALLAFLSIGRGYLEIEILVRIPERTCLYQRYRPPLRWWRGRSASACSCKCRRSIEPLARRNAPWKREGGRIMQPKVRRFSCMSSWRNVHSQGCSRALLTFLWHYATWTRTPRSVNPAYLNTCPPVGSVGSSPWQQASGGRTY